LSGFSHIGGPAETRSRSPNGLHFIATARDLQSGHCVAQFDHRSPSEVRSARDRLAIIGAGIGGVFLISLIVALEGRKSVVP
jgi:hypothetical protein